MSKKLILFLMVLLFGSTSFLRADEVVIGDGGTTTNSYLPSYSFYNYSLTQQIFTADEIGLPSGTINSIAFFNGGTEKTRTYDLYFVNTSKETFDSGTDWMAVTQADKVFSGSVTMVAGAWTTITLDTPFNYDGNNLLVVADDNTGSWASGMACYVFDAPSKAIRIYSDGTNYDPENPGAYSGTVLNVKNQIVLDITPGSGPTPPPTPVGELAIIPENFELGYRPNNAWMEPFNVKIYNGGEPVVMEASMSNTAGNTPFTMSEGIENVALATGESFDFTVNVTATAGVYAEEFTLFYAESERDVKTAPVTATVYAAVAPDVVEKPTTMNLTSGTYTDTPAAANIHPNYNLYGMTQKLPDVVYQFTLAKDSHFHASAGDNFIAIYNKVSDLHLTAEVEPVVIGENGVIEDAILLAGTYYLVAASENITTVTASSREMPAPTELAFVTPPTPADMAINVNAPVTIQWEGGEDATQYQVAFSTSPAMVNTPDPTAWLSTSDDNYGTYVVTDLEANTQYFFRVFARNSNGDVQTERRGFTTTLIAPNNVTASETEIFVDESTLIKWKLAGQGGFEGDVTVCDGTATSSYIPVYGLWMDDYTRCEMVYPAEMLEEMEGGEISSLTFYISSAASGPWSGNVFNVYMMEVDATTMTDFYGPTNANIVYTGGLDGQGSTMVINLDTPYAYDGGNLLVGIEEPTCSTWKSCSFYGIEATGASGSGYSSAALSSVSFTQRNFLPKTTFTCGGAKGNRNFLGYNIYYGQKDDNNVYQYTKANTQLLQERQYLLENLPYNMEGLDIKVTAVYNEGESGHSTPLDVRVKVSGYGTFTGTVAELLTGAPIEGANVKFMGKDEFNNNVTFQGTTNANGVYTINNVKAGTYIGEATYEGMEPNYSEEVTLEYLGTQTVDFGVHELYIPVNRVYAEELEPTTAKVTWSLHEFTTPNPGGNTPGGSASTFTEGFESGMPADWNVIDGNNDGWTWCLTSAIPSTWTYYASMSLDWYRTGTNAICSGSYINGVGALTPNEYLVTPQVTLAAGSTFSFWAAATDSGYPADHFGVAVSDNGTDFTMVQEWTLTAKEGANGGRASRDGNGAKLGTWYQYSVDLSSYAGQKYIAIRHFNCNDQYIMCVDDIALTAAKNRSVQEYAVYRKAILKEAELTEDDSVYFTNTTDTLYADFTWANMEPGLYQYGVSAIYPAVPVNKGDRSQTTVVYNFEDGTIPSDFNNTSAYPWGVVSNNGSNVIKSSNGGVASSTSTISLTYDYPSEGTIAFDALCMGEGTSTIWDKCIFKIDDQEMFCYGANQSGWHNYLYDVTEGTHTFTWTYSKDGSVNPTGDYFEVDNITLTYESAGGDTNDDPVTPITWSNILPKNMDAVVTVNASITIGTVEGAMVTLTNQFENLTYNAELDASGTVTFDEFRKGNYIVTVDLEGYMSDMIEVPMGIWNDSTVIDAHFTEIFKAVDNLYVSGTGFANWTAIIPAPDRVAEKYHVLLNNVFQGETTDNYMQFDTDLLTVGETYTAAVAVVYTTGMSEFVTADFTVIDCATVSTQVENLVGEANCMDIVLAWNGGTPGPGPGPGPQPGQDVTYDFEDSSFQGWTTIDGGSPSGYGWQVASTKLGTGYGHNGSLDCVLSQSYDNNYGVVYPDNYLISPAKAAYTSISFYACGQDASYAGEHFGVAVSTGGATASDFTMVQEWTMTAKGEGQPTSVTRSGNRAQGNWYQYTVDLSSYAGADIWVAIRHFNCSDMFYLDVDDITLTTGGTPGPGPTPPGPGPQPGPEETYDFEDSSFQGWTTIDGGSPSGYGWQVASTKLGTGYGHNGSSDCVLSQSYDNNYGVVYPDNFLISPAKAAYTSISFYACGQDASYAGEHFGVAVSTGGATASDFTMVQEWTMTAKGVGVPAPGRGGNNRAQGNWYQYTVDLSSYAGADIWVAIRHFNCSDMFYLDVDDITLTTAGKGGNLTADNCGVTYPAQPAEAMWDVLKTFDAAEGGQYGVVTDGTYIYTSNWGYSSAANNFYKYDMDGNMIEGFNISGCGTLRGMTYDGQYIYGVANSSTVYCVDLNNHALISTFTSAYGAMRCISYDAERDGFWVVGNWSGNLTLIDRTGAIVQAGPAPTSASDVAYYKDADGIEHVYCFNNGDNGVYDYNITTGVLGGQVFNYSSVPGFQSGASSGGCHIANYGDKLAFYGDVQQSPNLIAICELGAAQSGGGGGSSTATVIVPNKYNIFMDGDFIGATADDSFTITVSDTEEHIYAVVYVDAAYNFSCAAEVEVAAGTIPGVTDLTAEEGYDPTYGSGANISWNGTASSYNIYVNGQMLGTITDTSVFIYGFTAGTYTFGVVAVSGDCESEMVTVDFIYDAVEENSIITAIYPNPTSSDLHINATAMKHISVYNAMGQMVYDQDVEGDEVVLNMGQYETGVYMVNVITENGSSVKRITVTK